MIRLGLIVAVGMAVLALLAIPVDPVVGTYSGVVYGSVAWGIWRGHAWAALLGSFATGVPALRVMSMDGLPFQWLTGGLDLVAAVIFLLVAWRLPNRTTVRGWVAAMCITGLLFVAVRPYSMPSGSMEPTLETGDRILVENVSGWSGRTPTRGDVVVFHYPVDRKQTFTKPVEGPPGDRIRIEHKQLFRNGVVVREPWAKNAMDYEDLYRDNFPSEPNSPSFPQALQMLKTNVVNGEVVVPAGKYFVMGDNRDQSLDSRYWGFIDKKDLMGRPLLIYGSNEVKEGEHPTILNIRRNRLFRPLI